MDDPGTGAGQHATIVNGIWLERLFASWGTPVDPREPLHQAKALIQRDIDRILLRIHTLDGSSHPAAQDEAERLANLRHEAFTYITNLDLSPTNHSRALTAEEYQRLESNDHISTVINARHRPSFADIKARVDLLDYATTFTVFREAGKHKMKARCPLPDHPDDDTPSFFIYIDQRSWWCYGCSRGGDVIDLARILGRVIP